MLKIMIEKWDKNKDRLRKELLNTEMKYNYKELVKITFNEIYNDDTCEYGDFLDVDNLTEIDDGDYQGTLLYLIPFETYQPSRRQYLLTNVEYGSCSGCDTLLSITQYGRGLPNETQLRELMSLCKNIIQNTIKPYNYGWENDERFNRVELEQEWVKGE